MSFQRRSPQSAPKCPWCDQPMVPCDGSQKARLCCPTGDPVEYRSRGGRWYFSGRLLGLEEPMPEPPEQDEPDADPEPLKPSAARASSAARSSSAPPTRPTTPATANDAERPDDDLAAFRQVADALLDDADDESGADDKGDAPA